MSSAPSKITWLQQNYEKAILVAILLALLGSAGILVHKVREGRSLIDVSASVAKPSAAQSVQPLNFADVTNALQHLQEPPKARELPARMLTSELRVYCVGCGKWIPFDAAQCPFCGRTYEAPGAPEKEDTDRDGITDKWETEHGLDPTNPDDASLDADTDGFSNLEEFAAGTDPRDPKSHPAYATKLRLRSLRTETFKLRFVAVQDLGGGDLRYQLNARTLDRTYFKKAGDQIEGYTVEKYDQTNDVLTLRKGDIVKRLGRGKVIEDDQYFVTLVSLIDGREIRCKVGEVFAMRDEKCRLVEVVQPAHDSVRIRNEESSKEFVLARITPMEQAELEARRRTPLRLDTVPGAPTVTAPLRPVAPAGIPAPMAPPAGRR